VARREINAFSLKTHCAIGAGAGGGPRPLSFASSQRRWELVAAGGGRRSPLFELRIVAAMVEARRSVRQGAVPPVF